MIERRWESLRAGVRRLNILEINVLAGEVYNDLMPKFQTGQFSPVFNTMSAGFIELFIADPSPKNREQFLRLYGAKIDEFLARKGLVVEPETRLSLDFAIAKAIHQAVEQSLKFLDGDFSPDPKAGRFPTEPAKPAQTALPLHEWFSKYAETSKLAASTRKRWRPALATLEAAVGHDDLARVTPDNVADWVDALAAQGRSDKTIRDVYLASAKALFAWLQGKRKIAVNPCAGIRVKVVEGPLLRDRSFTEAEAYHP